MDEPVVISSLVVETVPAYTDAVAAELPGIEGVEVHGIDGHKIVVVGTTTMKALESSVYANGHVKTTEMNGKEDMWTNKFIYPP